MKPLRNLTDQELHDQMVAMREYQKSPKALPPETFRATEHYREVRRRSKADLFFLAKYVIGYHSSVNDLMLERVHRRICDLFVKKDDSKPLSEQDIRKERLLLYPRGTFKSTLDVIDAAQWLLNFVDIRILFITGGKLLAQEFLAQFKDIFTVKDEPSFINIYFSEFCVSESKADQGNAYSWVSPARKHFDKEPTVLASSVDSKLSGHHFDVMKADDCITNDTSENPDILKKIYTNFNVLTKMLMPYGYLDIVGTRYYDLDMYGELIDINVGDIEYQRDEIAGELPLWEYSVNKTTGLQVLIGRAMVPKPGIYKDVKDLLEEEAIILFPEYLSFKKLTFEWSKDERASEGQYNQNPRPKSITTFTLSLLQRQTVDHTKIPYSGPVTIVWDFAFSRRKNRDFQTGAAVRWDDKGRMYVIDIVRGRFIHNDLAKAVVKMVSDWRPVVLGIEDANGSNFLEPAIINEAKRTNNPDVLDICSRIDWIPVDTQLEAKKIRMSALHPWLVNEQLFFAKYLPYLDALYKEFELCLVSHHHDDIPDVISFQPRYAPRMNEVVQRQQTTATSLEDASFNLLFVPGSDAFGRVGYINPQAVLAPVPVERPPEAESAYDDAPSILGAGLFG